MSEYSPTTGPDINIPILLDTDKRITESNMSSILVQLKVCSARLMQDKVAVDKETIKYFSPRGSNRDAFADPNAPKDGREECDTRSYISLVMELGVVAPYNSGGMHPMVVHLLNDLGVQVADPLIQSFE
ncbi:hypothetical protein D9619_009761 [Psilocybe cf. subviscida]|uniref:Uncharacterized protein n=1 Tax=Psilocybe cf. subviscida TaxID=2480587 RepID=A0A8H5BN31_9AGAR|nr:hypothetical protein D9619_009761 [Psilocybe cf. subviscida]